LEINCVAFQRFASEEEVENSSESIPLMRLECLRKGPE